MQELQFEKSWDKAIAASDREKITDHFNKWQHTPNNTVQLQFYKKAINYKGELLITVIIHNMKADVLVIENMTINYTGNKQETITGTFTVPCPIKAKTSLPWTFIFSETIASSKQATYTIFEHP